MKQKKWHSARPGGMPLFLFSAPILPAFLFLVPAARAQLVLMLIFFFRRHPAPDMAFRFVDVQYHTRPGCKGRTYSGGLLVVIYPPKFTESGGKWTASFNMPAQNIETNVYFGDKDKVTLNGTNKEVDYDGTPKSVGDEIQATIGGQDLSKHAVHELYRI